MEISAIMECLLYSAPVWAPLWIIYIFVEWIQEKEKERHYRQKSAGRSLRSRRLSRRQSLPQHSAVSPEPADGDP